MIETIKNQGFTRNIIGVICEKKRIHFLNGNQFYLIIIVTKSILNYDTNMICTVSRLHSI